ncbi:hypothetical protein L596_009902 [Steinernema carpocapsae]|uniref:Uncharacterized protein n=1 Tax=Steinernema carpocapsae TaxID=34508 RepID=A0A4U5PGX7_STECR|nr:hypothetical protein L596_009902 [Steinernema carpocapsae]
MCYGAISAGKLWPIKLALVFTTIRDGLLIAVSVFDLITAFGQAVVTYVILLICLINVVMAFTLTKSLDTYRTYQTTAVLLEVYLITQALIAVDMALTIVFMAVDLTNFDNAMQKMKEEDNYEGYKNFWKPGFVAVIVVASVCLIEVVSSSVVMELWWKRIRKERRHDQRPANGLNLVVES